MCIRDRINTLPMEMKDSIDNQNGYILQLFLYKKKKLQDGTKYGYVSAIKRLVTMVYKPLTDMEESDIYYYLDWYENRNVPITGKKNQARTINNERRFLSAFFTWMRKEKLGARLRRFGCRSRLHDGPHGGIQRARRRDQTRIPS